MTVVVERSKPDGTIVYRSGYSRTGVAPTTPVHVRPVDGGQWEARMGYAVCGTADMTLAEFELCGFDPFHQNFRDKYASGVGDSPWTAVEKLKEEIDLAAVCILA